MSNAKVKPSIKLGWVARNFRANPSAAKWNDATIVLGCLCSIPLVAYTWTGIETFWHTLEILSLVWLGCLLTSFFMTRNSDGA